MSDPATTPGAVAERTLGFVLRGAVRIVADWPGMVALLVAYVVVAVPTAAAGVGYPQLLGVVAAAVVGAGWYASPLGRWEGRRRQRA